jgi:hypothetical protein
MNYAEARDVLSGKLAYGYARKLVKPNPNRDRVKIANNTHLERRAETSIALVLHSTDVVTFTPHYAELRTGGWHTMTTADRLRMAPGAVYGNSKHGWTWTAINPEKPCYSCDGTGTSEYGDWTNPDGSSAHELWKEAGANPAESISLYMKTGEGGHWTLATCRQCQGTGIYPGLDFEGRSFPFFEGMRVRNDGTGILKTQPNRPARLSPVKTERGFMYGY